jgi:hypothetical protein
LSQCYLAPIGQCCDSQSLFAGEILLRVAEVDISHADHTVVDVVVPIVSELLLPVEIVQTVFAFLNSFDDSVGYVHLMDVDGDYSFNAATNQCIESFV